MPNRIIKESICTSDTLSRLSDFQENFFYRLIVSVDDYGRLDARPAIGPHAEGMDESVRATDAPLESPAPEDPLSFFGAVTEG